MMMKKEDYDWCYNGNVACSMSLIGNPTIVGWDACGSDGCDYETCGWDCGHSDDW